MNNEWQKALAILIFSVFLFACPSSEKTYERIVIDTYSPDDNVTANTYIDLFDAGGDPDADDPWTGDDTGDAIAFDDDGNTSDYAGMSRIDYTAGLSSGTYYIRVRGLIETVDDYYAIRVLSLNLVDALPPYDFPGVWAAKPDLNEDDDSPQSGGVPVSPVTIQLGNTNWVNRSIDDPTPSFFDGNGDVDWFKLVLP